MEQDAVEGQGHGDQLAIIQEGADSGDALAGAVYREDGSTSSMMDEKGKKSMNTRGAH